MKTEFHFQFATLAGTPGESALIMFLVSFKYSPNLSFAVFNGGKFVRVQGIW